MGAYSKHILCQFATTTTRCNFNFGHRPSTLIYVFMSKISGKYTLLECNRMNKVLRVSKRDSSEPIKKQWKIIFRKAKQKDDENEQKVNQMKLGLFNANKC